MGEGRDESGGRRVLYEFGTKAMKKAFARTTGAINRDLPSPAFFFIVNLLVVAFAAIIGQCRAYNAVRFVPALVSLLAVDKLLSIQPALNLIASVAHVEITCPS